MHYIVALRLADWEIEGGRISGLSQTPQNPEPAGLRRSALLPRNENLHGGLS